MARLVLIFIPLSFLASQSFAGLGARQSMAFKENFYLEGPEVKKLKAELIRMKFDDDEFVLKFVCNKHKRTPRAKHRSINCMAISVSPQPVPQSSPKVRRRNHAR